MNTNRKQSGFTLVELAIVLVIIGLIIGGVLVGQDLIKAAENNAAVQQFEKTDAAVNTFRTKYNGFPGDVLNPANFGLLSGSTGTNAADGDGLIEAGACTDLVGFGGESAVFWNHLQTAGLVTSGAGTPVTDYGANAIELSGNDAAMPQSKFAKGNRIHVTNVAGRNVYALSNFGTVTTASCAIAAVPAVTPLQASNLDAKKDDGVANTGLVVSILGSDASSTAGGSSTPDSTVGTPADDCYDTDTGAYATTTAALQDALACSLRIRASF